LHGGHSVLLAKSQNSVDSPLRAIDQQIVTVAKLIKPTVQLVRHIPGFKSHLVGNHLRRNQRTNSSAVLDIIPILVGNRVDRLSTNSNVVSFQNLLGKVGGFVVFKRTDCVIARLSS